MKHSLNFKEINKLYPNAFREWVQSSLANSIVKVLVGEYAMTCLTDKGREYTYSLTEHNIWAFPSYFDGFEIEIEVGVRQSKKTFFVRIEGCSRLVDVHHKDRLTATEAGIQKAFEIRELQLLKEQKP